MKIYFFFIFILSLSIISIKTSAFENIRLAPQISSYKATYLTFSDANNTNTNLNFGYNFSSFYPIGASSFKLYLGLESNRAKLDITRSAGTGYYTWEENQNVSINQTKYNVGFLYEFGWPWFDNLSFTSNYLTHYTGLGISLGSYSITSTARYSNLLYNYTTSLLRPWLIIGGSRGFKENGKWRIFSDLKYYFGNINFENNTLFEDGVFIDLGIQYQFQ